MNNKVILAFDNDVTGVRKAIEHAEKGFKVFVWPDIDYKDFNEMIQDGYQPCEIKAMIQAGTEKGIMAITKLKMKDVL
jgi:DNA primase